MKTILCLLVLVTGLAVQGGEPRQGGRNPAADKQAEREALREERRREAEDRIYRQLLLEYLDRIARQRR